MTSERECYVYIVPPGETEFVTAGRLRVVTTDAGEGVGAFVYGRRYLARADAVELDPVELRLSDAAYETARMQGFFGAIRDAMPDDWGRRVIEKHAGRVNLDEFDYLLEGPDDRAGALGFGLGVEPPPPRGRFNRTLDLERLQRGADAIIANAPVSAVADAAQIQDLMLLGTSMGGARPKAVVQDGGALWIAKFSRPDDRWNHPRVEHAMLTLARACGIDAAESRIVTVAGRDVLLVRRFDRDAAESGGYRRHRMVSALTLLRSGDSPTDRANWSYLLLADEVRRASARPEPDLRELFARICFNAAVSNTDDHPRNHAILAKDRNWRLSPAFDLTPTPSVSLERDLALVCGPRGRYANRHNIIDAHGRFLLNAHEAETIFDKIAGIVNAEWHPTMRRIGVSDTDCETITSAFSCEGLLYKPAVPAKR